MAEKMSENKGEGLDELSSINAKIRPDTPTDELLQLLARRKELEMSQTKKEGHTVSPETTDGALATSEAVGALGEAEQIVGNLPEVTELGEGAQSKLAEVEKNIDGANFAVSRFILKWANFFGTETLPSEVQEKIGDPNASGREKMKAVEGWVNEMSTGRMFHPANILGRDMVIMLASKLYLLSDVQEDLEEWKARMKK